MLSYSEFKKTAASGWGAGNRVAPGQPLPLSRSSMGNADKVPVDHSRIYTNVFQLPKVPEEFDQSIGGPGRSFLNKSLAGFRNIMGALRAGKRGYTRYRVRNNPGSTVGYLFAGPNDLDVPFDPEWPDGKEKHYIEIDPTRLPNFRNGIQLLAPTILSRALRQPRTMNIKSLDNAWFNVPNARAWSDKLSKLPDNTPMVEQPYDNAQLIAMESGDPGYLNRLLAHYKQVPEADWEKANLQLSDDTELAAWQKDVPKVTLEDSPLGVAYNMETGKLHMPEEFLGSLNDTWSRLANQGWKDYTSNESLGDQAILSPSYAGMVAGMFNHENRHRSTIGRVRLGRYPYIHAYNRAYDPNKPASETNIPTLLRQRNWYPFLQDAQQLEWTKKHALQPYAVDEPEMNQALMSMNAGRYALKRDMQKDPDNPNYKQIKPEVLKKFQELPDFIEPGEKGRQQLDEMMQLFIENPELRVLMPEQSRLVGYYSNLKAAIENLEDPEEKQYFQNLMDRFIYSKAFLANNQRRVIPSYTDVQRMRA